MNQRIKDIERQCWSHRVDGALIDGQLHFDTAKFAELIVRECAKVAFDDWCEGTNESSSQIAILKHFNVGVEE